MRVLQREIRCVRGEVQFHRLLYIIDIRRTRIVPSPVRTRPNTLRVHLKSNHDLSAPISIFSRGSAISNHEREMIVDVIPVLPRAQRDIFVPNLEPRSIILAALVHGDETRCPRQIINNPFRHISLLHHLPRALEILPANGLRAEEIAFLILAHHQLDVRLCDSIAAKDLAQIQGYALSAQKRGACMFDTCGRADKGEVVVCVLQLGVIRVDFVDEEGDCFVVFVALDRPACFVSHIHQRLECRATWDVESFCESQACQEEEPRPQA